MEKLVVGSDACKPVRIVLAIQSHTSTASIFFSKLAELSINLDVYETYEDNKLLHQLGNKKSSEVFLAILNTWVQKERDNATLAKLVEVLEKHNLNDSVRAIEIEFGIKADSHQAQDIQVSGNFANNQRLPATMATEIQISTDVKLFFGDRDVKHQVLPKIKPGLLKILNNANTNMVIISQLEGLEIFDHQEIEPIQTNVYTTEYKRMVELFSLIANLDYAKIKLCLEKLCNLEDMRTKRESIREHFSQLYPGCFQVA